MTASTAFWMRSAWEVSPMWRSIMHDDSRSAVGLALFCEHDAKSGVRQWRKRRRKMAVHVDGLGSTPRPSRQHRVCYDGRIARPASSPPLPPLRSLRLSVTAVTTTHHRHHHYPACKSLQSPPPACHLPRDVRCRAVDRLCQEEVVAAHVAGGGEAQAALNAAAGSAHRGWHQRPYRSRPSTVLLCWQL